MEGGGGAGLAAIIVVLVILSLWSGGIQSMTVCSRVLFSLARDEALPISQRWSVVSERFQTSIQAVWLCASISLALLVCVKMFHASDIIMVVLSFSIISLHISYAIPICIKLIRGEKQLLLQDAPWRLGNWIKAINWIALIWLIASIVLAAGFIHHAGLCRSSIAPNRGD